LPGYGKLIYRALCESGTGRAAPQDAAGFDTADLTSRDPRDAMSLQTAWLRSFLAVADKSGFGAATLVLHLSSPGSSAHIAALEHALGVSLFDRKARPVCMTEAGELFRGHALTALLELQSGIDAARSTLDNFVAHVTIGSYPSVSSAYLPSVLRELKTKYPGVTVDLVEGPRHRWKRWSSTGPSISRSGRCCRKCGRPRSATGRSGARHRRRDARP